ncbi:hypothetical protein CQA37_09890 [Helicobacter sp. MIT 99-10781]|nr:hypothetical protein CQA37_09890 [Helicobacter sp. MIT 99-10781]
MGKIRLARLFRTKLRKSFGYAQKVRALQLFLTFAQTRHTMLEFFGSLPFLLSVPLWKILRLCA